MSRAPHFPFATPEDIGLDATARPGFVVTQESRFDALEEDLASLIVPWDSDADCARIAREAGLPDDARFIAAAQSRMRANHVDPEKEERRLKEASRLRLVKGEQE